MTYRSKGVLITTGSQAAKVAASTEGVGFTQEEIEDLMEFAQDIIIQAKARKLSPALTFTAILNAMIFMLDTADPDGKNSLISVVTEAMCAVVGGGGDQGTRS